MCLTTLYGYADCACLRKVHVICQPYIRQTHKQIDDSPCKEQVFDACVEVGTCGDPKENPEVCKQWFGREVEEWEFESEKQYSARLAAPPPSVWDPEEEHQAEMDSAVERLEGMDIDDEDSDDEDNDNENVDPASTSFAAIPHVAAKDAEHNKDDALKSSKRVRFAVSRVEESIQAFDSERRARLEAESRWALKAAKEQHSKEATQNKVGGELDKKRKWITDDSDEEEEEEQQTLPALKRVSSEDAQEVAMAHPASEIQSEDGIDHQYFDLRAEVQIQDRLYHATEEVDSEDEGDIMDEEDDILTVYQEEYDGDGEDLMEDDNNEDSDEDSDEDGNEDSDEDSDKDSDESEEDYLGPI